MDFLKVVDKVFKDVVVMKVGDFKVGIKFGESVINMVGLKLFMDVVWEKFFSEG